MKSKLITGYSTESAGAVLGVTERRVRQIISECGIKPKRIGGAILLSEGQLAKMKTRNTQRGPRGPRSRK